MYVRATVADPRIAYMVFPCHFVRRVIPGAASITRLEGTSKRDVPLYCVRRPDKRRANASNASKCKTVYTLVTFARSFDASPLIFCIADAYALVAFSLRTVQRYALPCQGLVFN